MILVDSSVWIDYFNSGVSRRSALLDSLLGDQPLATADLIVAEVLQGFKTDAAFKKGLELLSTLAFYQIGGLEIAKQSALNYRSLRKRGISVRSTIDSLIATFCIVNDLILLHADRDFYPFERHCGLKSYP